MQTKNAQTIYDEIVAHIRKQGSSASLWYAGITQDINQRLFVDHAVPKEDHWRIHHQATSSEDARKIEKALLDWGCDGGPGGGNDAAVFVYAYLKTAITNP